MCWWKRRVCKVCACVGLINKGLEQTLLQHYIHTWRMVDLLSGDHLAMNSTVVQVTKPLNKLSISMGRVREASLDWHCEKGHSHVGFRPDMCQESIRHIQVSEWQVCDPDTTCRSWKSEADYRWTPYREDCGDGKTPTKPHLICTLCPYWIDEHFKRPSGHFLSQFEMNAIKIIFGV